MFPSPKRFLMIYASQRKKMVWIKLESCFPWSSIYFHNSRPSGENSDRKEVGSQFLNQFKGGRKQLNHCRQHRLRQSWQRSGKKPIAWWWTIRDLRQADDCIRLSENIFSFTLNQFSTSRSGNAPSASDNFRNCHLVEQNGNEQRSTFMRCETIKNCHSELYFRAIKSCCEAVRR